ncbi:CpaD family pilus assembly protein [Allosphingosinicella flava]|nr:CpaD family pilus assembly protein [Sphingosinicella flava]
MSRIIASAAVATAASLLTGCSADKAGLPTNRSVYSIHQPVVQRTDYVLDLAQSGSGLPQAEADRLAAWFDSLRLGYGDAIHVDGGYGAETARADVARVAGDYGLMLSDGAPVTAGTVQPGSIRVIVSRTTASVPGCPDWRYAATPGGQISTPPNFGCAMNSNLAAMVADPNDLVLGQPGAPSGDSATAAKAIKAYRTAPPTGAGGLDETSTKGGN